MTNRTIEAVLRISAKLGSLAGLAKLQSEMRKVDDIAGKVNRSHLAAARSNTMLTRGVTSGARAMVGAIGSVLTVSAGKAAVTNYAAIERRIERIGITADSSADKTQAMQGKLRKLAQDLKVPFAEVVEGMDMLVSTGKSADEALAFLPSVGKTAHAAGADWQEMASTADTLSGALEISADRMQDAMDILAYGGKVGKFELKDMAAELPSLTPAFAAMGYRGEEGLKKLVAMLQGVRRETGTSSEAATALQNVFQKINVDQTAKKFGEFGIDLRKELKRAKEEGRDLIDTFVELSIKATGGDLDKLPQLITDAQFLQGVRALINQREQIKAWQGDLSNAAGTVEKDISRLSKNAQADLDDLSNSWDKLVASAGKTIIDLGAVDALSSLGDELNRDSAMRAQLMKEGYSSAVAWLKVLSMKGSKEGDDLLWRSGERTEGQRKQIDGYGQYATERTKSEQAAARFIDGKVVPSSGNTTKNLPSSVPVPGYRDGTTAARDGSTFIDGEVLTSTERDKTGFPVTGPVPTFADREVRDFENDYQRQMREQAVRAELDMTRFPPPTADTIKQLNDKDIAAATAPSEPTSTGIHAAMGLYDAGQGIADGGEKAGQSIEEAARAINEAGRTGGSIFKQMLDGLGRQIGQDAAAAFRDGVGTIPVQQTGSANSLPEASGNKGRTMPNAGQL